ncbi:unnamed protein product [Ranitomeya imitator]|uniref:Integrator complex subunit 14 n=1 Tax=Ranitomeya imitator TaxID=111125 RepID=A0ABN9LJW4_9NEOB|nr:unnamed protein product [Ranitomeya imitator]
MPTVVVMDVSLSMTRPVPVEGTEDFQRKHLAAHGLTMLFEHMATNYKLEFTALVVFSSLWELMVPFTRDYNTLQEALSNIDDYDKTCLESALQGVSSVVQQEWGATIPCQVVLVTDGCLGIGRGSLHNSLSSLQQRSESNRFPLPFPFPSKLYIMCMANLEEAGPSRVQHKIVTVPYAGRTHSRRKGRTSPGSQKQASQSPKEENLRLSPPHDSRTLEDITPVGSQLCSFSKSGCLLQKTVPKKGGSVLPILDLKQLNKYVRVRHFRMESLRSIIASMEKGEYLAFIDIQDAYLHIPIPPAHQSFLRFAIDQDHYQFVALPFGLATAPRVFTKVMAATMDVLHTRGIVVVPYLDDLLIKAPTFKDCELSVSITTDTLSHTGWLVNLQRSSPTPSQSLTFLGMLFNTSRGLVLLPKDKALALRLGVRTFSSANLLDLSGLP